MRPRLWSVLLLVKKRPCLRIGQCTARRKGRKAAEGKGRESYRNRGLETVWEFPSWRDRGSTERKRAINESFRGPIDHLTHTARFPPKPSPQLLLPRRSIRAIILRVWAGKSLARSDFPAGSAGQRQQMFLHRNRKMRVTRVARPPIYSSASPEEWNARYSYTHTHMHTRAHADNRTN